MIANILVEEFMQNHMFRPEGPRWPSMLNDFLLKRASEGAPFWRDIKISCPLLSLRIVFEALHLLPAQFKAGH